MTASVTGGHRDRARRVGSPPRGGRAAPRTLSQTTARSGLETLQQVPPKSGISNFVRMPSIYARLAWASFIGESPNPARTMNGPGTANAFRGEHQVGKTSGLRLPTWSLNRTRDQLVTITPLSSGLGSG